MEPIRFADILFTFLTLLIIYLILMLVKRPQRKKKQALDDAAEVKSDKDSSTEESS